MSGMDSSSTIIALHISTKTYPMPGRFHDARPSLLEGIDAAGITLLFSREKALLKLPRLDLPCRQWVRGRANIRPRGRSGEDGEALRRRGSLSAGRSILRIGPRQRRGASS